MFLGDAGEYCWDAAFELGFPERSCVFIVDGAAVLDELSERCMGRRCLVLVDIPCICDEEFERIVI